MLKNYNKIAISLEKKKKKRKITNKNIRLSKREKFCSHRDGVSEKRGEM